ncbi:SGNH/GDSL hydrolase family protein [Myxococcota bacterium]|nr:SGNH/GDSL hydrolase family protein [Myxococcota bacterium]
MKRLAYPLYLIVCTAFLLTTVEAGSFLILKARGEDAHLLSYESKAKTAKRTDEDDLEYATVDPHLGYTHGPREKKVEDRSDGFVWLDGFLIYADRASDLERPVILALGGSTTDGIRVGHSWPEELARILEERRIPGTVINGGIGGYSTNQELLKLIRDGLEFEPDFVISYSGINDRGRYGELPHPMVHSYQRQMLEVQTGRAPSRILPSTMAFLRGTAAPWRRAAMDYTMGLPTARSLGQQYRRNLEIMHAVCRSQGCRFDAFIQPFAYYQSKFATILEPDEKRVGYIAAVNALYSEIVELPATHDFVHDATAILEQVDDVYMPDGVHLNQKGDAVVADHVFGVLEPELREHERVVAR